jgi:hypothetical protein
MRSVVHPVTACYSSRFRRTVQLRSLLVVATRRDGPSSPAGLMASRRPRDHAGSKTLFSTIEHPNRLRITHPVVLHCFS